MVNAHACGIFPAPFPDETCYSLMCRYAVRRGHLTSSQVCLDLFGHTEPLAGYLFKPFRKKDVLKWFAKRSSLPLTEFVADHSCYPFYAAFLEREDADKVRHCRTGSVLTSGQAKRINRLCGFPRGHKKNLWYCPECVREDITMHGETCWRRLPQMPGAVWCPAHGVALRESGTRVQDINYQLIPATYALMHVCDPEQETGTVYAERYLGLSRDIAWLLKNGDSIPDGEWMARNYLQTTGRSINTYLLHDISGSSSRGNRFEDYLANRIMKDIGKDSIDAPVSRQIGSILSIEKAFGSMEKFCER